MKPGGAIKKVCDDARAWLRALFVELAIEAGAREPEQLAEQFVLLYDGAAVAAQMDRNTKSAVSARAMAELLLNAATV